MQTPAPHLPHTLQQWLDYCEQLHPKTIAMGLERVAEVARRLDLRFDCPVITVAGTNGKGSTCAMIEAVAQESGYRTGVYSSPHIVHFEERCRIRGEPVAADALLEHFAAVEQARTAGGGAVELTYFEFTTLAILRLMSRAGLDLAVLEVGLGGRLDATNVIDADCAVITSVDVDHVEFLGSDREAIGREKAGIMRPGRPVVVSDPVPPDSVMAHAHEIGAELWRFGSDFNYSGDQQQWAWAGRGRRYAGLAYPSLRGANQLINASGALAALNALRDRVPITAQAVRVGLSHVELPGRFQVIAGQPTLILDVAHNPHAVSALAANLDAMGSHFQATHAVVGAMADKDLPQMLARIAPQIDCWYFADLPTPRAASAQDLKQVLHALQTGQHGKDLLDAALPRRRVQKTTAQPGQGSAHLVVSRTRGGVAASHGAAPEDVEEEVPVSLHASPEEALTAALEAARPADRIVVFGSFYTVGGVLENGLPRLKAKHLAV